MINVSRGAHYTLIKYQELLLKWNKAINLVSRSSENNIWPRHILDSLQLLNYIDPSDKVIDLGSGGGFPGIVLSIGGVEDITLIECDERKSIFLFQAAKLSENRVTVIRKKVDSGFASNCDVLTCRGCASLINILDMTSGIEIKKKILLLKGESYQREIAKARRYWLFDVDVYDSITSSNGKVLAISKIYKR